MQVELHPIATGPEDTCPFGADLTEFPWQAQFRAIQAGSVRRLLGVVADGALVGAMALDETKRPPQLVFFEITRDRRGEGIGKSAIRTLMAELKRRGKRELFIQTGRSEIYRNMGFLFVPVARAGILLSLQTNLDAPAVPSMPPPPLTLVYDEAYQWHDVPELPETSQRLSVTLEALERRGLLDELGLVQPRLATMEELRRVHSAGHIERVRVASHLGRALGPDTQTCIQTFDTARLAFGGALLAGEQIEEWRRAFVLCRPPGHHASADKASGFCFFNNMAGLAVALHQRGYRPMVVDWDAHHGNGTQALLYDKPIVFVSFHQRDLYPGTGLAEEKGTGAGLGYNYNIPLPPLCTDAQYLDAFSVLPEIARKHEPDIILVSAGQDGHHSDKLSGMLLTTDCYRQMARTVRHLAEEYASDRIICLLEGGYNRATVGEINAAIIEELAGLTAQVTKRHE